jgi:hypothetical protein
MRPLKEHYLHLWSARWWWRAYRTVLSQARPRGGGKAASRTAQPSRTSSRTLSVAAPEVIQPAPPEGPAGPISERSACRSAGAPRASCPCRRSRIHAGSRADAGPAELPAQKAGVESAAWHALAAAPYITHPGWPVSWLPSPPSWCRSGWLGPRPNAASAAVQPQNRPIGYGQSCAPSSAAPSSAGYDNRRILEGCCSAG